MTAIAPSFGYQRHSTANSRTRPTHPAFLIGHVDLRALQVIDAPLGQKICDTNKEGTVTTVLYVFPKPGTTTPCPNESDLIRVGGQGCGVGSYTAVIVIGGLDPAVLQNESPALSRAFSVMAGPIRQCV